MEKSLSKFLLIQVINQYLIPNICLLCKQKHLFLNEIITY